MGMDISCGKEKFKLMNVFKYVKYKARFYKDNPDYFIPDGLLCFTGPQGSGKSLSAVNYVYKIMNKYPKCKLCTNLLLKDYPIITFDEFKKEKIKNEKISDKEIYKIYLKENRVFPFINNDDFKKYNNNKKGVVFLVDEIQLYMNSLESKNINMDTMVQIAQQRKQRKHIVGTSQVFGRMAKQLREQFNTVIVCNEYFGCIQRNRIIDRDSIDDETSSSTEVKGKVKKQLIWIHDPDLMYSRYDTYSVIERGKFVEGDKQKEGVYDASYRLSANS